MRPETSILAADLYPGPDVARAVRVLQSGSIRSPDRRNTKFLMMTSDEQFVETGVFDHRQNPDWDGDSDLIICFSSQVGCDQRCPFCESGAPKKIPGQEKPVRLIRNLTSEEIVGQVKNAIELFDATDDSSLLRLSAMGMGEPMDNYGALREAIDQFRRLWPYRARVTVSTICRESDVSNILNLAAAVQDNSLGVPLKMHFSLHAPNEALRQKLVPKGGSLATVLDTAYEFARRSKTQPKLNYVLMAGRNDTPEHAAQLGQLLQTHPVSSVATLKLSELNPYGIYKPSSTEVVGRFAAILEDRGIRVSRFSSALDGGLVQAGCGQLRKHVLDEVLYQHSMKG